MNDFDRSIGLQHVWTLAATRCLLIGDRNGTLNIRSNFVGVTSGTTVELEHGKVTLLDSGHMLGSAQVAYEHPDGYRTGYSGDFSWPLNQVIQVDELVVDSTYGSPDSVRRYSQDQADDALRAIVTEKVMNGPVYIYAWRGTLHRALVVLGGISQFPIVVDHRQFKEQVVYQKFGFGIPPVLASDSDDAQAAMHEGRFILVSGRGSRLNMNLPEGYSITLSARLVQGVLPVLETSQSSCHVALTDHADFEDTLEYVQRTGAQRVLTDNARGPNGLALALAISNRLGIDAKPGGDIAGFGAHEWGT